MTDMKFNCYYCELCGNAQPCGTPCGCESNIRLESALTDIAEGRVQKFSSVEEAIEKLKGMEDDNPFDCIT